MGSKSLDKLVLAVLVKYIVFKTIRREQDATVIE